MINAPMRKRSLRHPFTHRYPPTMPMHREREAEMIRNSKIAWLQGIIALIILLSLAFVLGTVQARATTTPETPTATPLTASQLREVMNAYSLPVCKAEDGSNQDLCVWDDGTGDRLVNMGFGSFTYNIATGQMIDYRSGTATVVTAD